MQQHFHRYSHLRTAKQSLIARFPSGEGHTRAVRTLQFADDGTLVSGSYDKTVKGTPALRPCAGRRDEEPHGRIHSTVVGVVWDMQTGKDKATLKSHTTCICCLKFNDRMIVSGSFKAIKLWDTKTYKPITYRDRRHYCLQLRVVWSVP